MQINTTQHIVKTAKRLVETYGTRKADVLAQALGITILPVAFAVQKGFYKVIERNRFIFIKDDLHPVMHEIVLLHEIGHDVLHRKEAAHFQEFNIFDMQNSRMEYEANMFAAEVSLPDDEVLSYIYAGYDAAQIAMLMHSDINLVALKVAEMNRRGFSFRPLEHDRSFLQ